MIQRVRLGKNKLTYGDYNLDVNIKPISHNSLDRFIKALDIGELHQINGYSGINRTVSVLTTMIVDLNLKVSSLQEKFQWFNGNVKYYVVEF